MFGTSPFFRTHPKGGLSQAARVLAWAGPEGEPVVAPGGSSVEVAPVARVTYPGDATGVVSTTDAEGQPANGTVGLFVDGGDEPVASGDSTGGTASLTVGGLTPGTTSVVARFTPESAASEPSRSAPASIRVTKAPSTLGLRVKDGPGRRVEVVLALRVRDVPTTGRAVLRDNGRQVRSVRVTAGEREVLRVALDRGRHVLRARFAGTDLVRASFDRVRVRVL